ncbi:MAG: tetratricopeptide repeat protein [Deltaproteobacteria bacterium]|nr:tetratricopeptide repeat protein [Candidatus Zymogenaceae bacterium]
MARTDSIRTMLIAASAIAVCAVSLFSACPAARAEQPDDSAASWYGKGLELADDLEYGKAIECFDRALEIEPDYEQALVARGSVLLNIGRYEDTYRDLNRAVELDPQDTAAYYIRGLVYEQVNNYENAAADYTAALMIEPDNVDCLLRRGLANREIGKTDEAIADFRRACNLGYGYACDEVEAMLKKGQN